jgi:hypothetical protein
MLDQKKTVDTSEFDAQTVKHYKTLKEAKPIYDALYERDGNVWVLECPLGGLYCIRPRVSSDPQPARKISKASPWLERCDNCQTSLKNLFNVSLDGVEARCCSNCITNNHLTGWSI